jgi:hypothetical protein
MLKLIPGKKTLGSKQIFQWGCKFRNREASVNDAKRLGCSTQVRARGVEILIMRFKNKLM